MPRWLRLLSSHTLFVRGVLSSMNNFYDLKTRNDLADFLGISRSYLTYLLYIKGVNNCYSSFEITKSNGNKRKIHAPNKELKSIQTKLTNELYLYRQNTNRNTISHAFEKMKGIITNAEKHRNKRYVLNIDLKDFFDSFHFGRVRGFFIKDNRFSLPKEVATIIAQLTCFNGTLPQGAPSSPIITNFICEILDSRILKLIEKYRVIYTRYADDLTFSTNDRIFKNNFEDFYNNIKKTITDAGFNINEKKVWLQYKDSRQTVTGLVVNKKLNVNRDFYKKTRAMANHLYKYGEFKIGNDFGTIEKLEGRFAFINQICKYNNKKTGVQKTFYNLNGRERQYQMFLFYKYFWANPKPLIITEGKTDITYLKAALKGLYTMFPELISKYKNNKFEYHITFLNRTDTTNFFLGINGGDSLHNVLKLYNNNNFLNSQTYPNYFRNLRDIHPKNPVILLFDNELNRREKPLSKFLNDSFIKSKKKDTILKDRYKAHIIENLFALTIPELPNENKNEYELEDLFKHETLDHRINGKAFSRSNNIDPKNSYGKEVFSRYIYIEIIRL